MNTKPNLLLIITDQQSASMMSCADNPYVKTPNMDWLSSRGIRFEHAYCTNPVCVPSRFSLMTGRYPSAIEQRCNDRGPVDRQKAEECYKQGLGWLLKKGGYETVYAGKQHLPWATAEDAGFKVLELNERGEMGKSCAQYFKENTKQPFAMVASFVNPHDICYMAIRDSIGSRYESENALALVERGCEEIHCLDEALQIPSGMSEEDFFASCCPPLPENHSPQSDEAEGVSDLINQRPFRMFARESYSEKRWRLHRWAYARLTERVDREIGILLDGLRSSGRDKDTLIIFTSDHGDHDSSHKLEHKTIPYQEAVRIPLIVCPPEGMEKGEVNNTDLVCNGLDILPTLCDYAGVDAPTDLQGRSLRPLIDGDPPSDWRKALYIESENSLSVNTRDWQYTLFDSGENREQLYDLVNDPGQIRNHSFDSQNSDILQQHRNLLEKHMALCPF